MKQTKPAEFLQTLFLFKVRLGNYFRAFIRLNAEFRNSRMNVDPENPKNGSAGF